MEDFFNRRIDGDYPIMMLDGMVVGKMTVIAVMEIERDGHKRMLVFLPEALKIRRPSKNC